MQTEIGQVDVKLDRITITGVIEESNQTLEKIMGELRWELEPDLRASAPWFRLTRNIGGDVYETVAVLMKNEFQNSWRLDTSNHLNNGNEKKSIQRVVLMMKDRHTTRIDVAFDFINCKYPGMKHVITKKNVTKTNFTTNYYGRGGSVETIYAGKRRSQALIRYYDKYVEQKRARKQIPEYIKNWERLELQLRSNKTGNWLKEADLMLDNFKLPEYEKIEKIDELINVVIAIEHPEILKRFSKNRKSKTNKLIEANSGFNVEYAETAKKVLKNDAEKVQKEIDEFLLLLNRK